MALVALVEIVFLVTRIRHQAQLMMTQDPTPTSLQHDRFMTRSRRIASSLRDLRSAAGSLPDAVVLLDNEQPSAANDDDPWSARDGWRIGAPATRTFAFAHDAWRTDVAASGTAGNYELSVGEQHCRVTNATRSQGGRSGRAVIG